MPIFLQLAVIGYHDERLEQIFVFLQADTLFYNFHRLFLGIDYYLILEQFFIV